MKELTQQDAPDVSGGYVGEEGCIPMPGIDYPQWPLTPEELPPTEPGQQGPITNRR